MEMFDEEKFMVIQQLEILYIGVTTFLEKPSSLPRPKIHPAKINKGYNFYVRYTV
jgi:hypothetical protein